MEKFLTILLGLLIVSQRKLEDYIINRYHNK